MASTGLLFGANQDPRLSHTLSEFIIAGNSQNVISYIKLSFQEYRNGFHWIVKNVLDDYLPELQEQSLRITLTKEEYLKYQFNPKKLASDIYGTTEVYYVILALNNMASIREFDTYNLILLKRADMNSFLQSIYKSEKASIATYNNKNNRTD